MKSSSKKSTQPNTNANETKDTSKQNGSKIGLTKEELAAKVEEMIKDDSEKVEPKDKDEKAILAAQYEQIAKDVIGSKEPSKEGHDQDDDTAISSNSGSTINGEPKPPRYEDLEMSRKSNGSDNSSDTIIADVHHAK